MEDTERMKSLDSLRVLTDASSPKATHRGSVDDTKTKTAPTSRVDRGSCPESLKPLSRISSLGLERDDWEIRKSRPRNNINMERTSAAPKPQPTTRNSTKQRAPPRFSTKGLELVKDLREKDIFKQWSEAVSQSDSRFPVVQKVMQVGNNEKSCIKKRFRQWASSFRKCDPRYKILKFFNDVAQEGADDIWNVDSTEELPKCFSIFNRASVFTVWRPCSIEAIRKMMLGLGVGKGLDIKGKSAKRGKHSGYVPFLQIHKEHHKRRIRTLQKNGMLRVFYATREARDIVKNNLESVRNDMMNQVRKAREVLADERSDMKEREAAFQHLMWDMTDPVVHEVDDNAPKCFGLLVSERLFWEGYVMRQDCERVDGSTYDNGRPSEPAFQDLNFAALRTPPIDNAPRAVLWHADDAESPMCPQNLLMAYEEQGRVVPVVSDFDCLLIGTRRVTYECDLSPDQLHLLKWCVDQVETILDSPDSDDNWTVRWLEVRKRAALKGFNPECPRFGFGDFKSYSIMQRACGRLVDDGCVRHGAECFNYYFPQELDEEFLVISDSLPGKLAWKYMGIRELQEHLCHRIDEGYTLPLNPKWVLCDAGWKNVYDRLIASSKQNIRNSMDVWFPPTSGIREKIEAIAARHPSGFQVKMHKKYDANRPSSKTSISLGELEIKHQLKLQQAKRKILKAISVSVESQNELRNNIHLKALELERSKSAEEKKSQEHIDSINKMKTALKATLFVMKLQKDLANRREESAHSVDSDVAFCAPSVEP